MVCLMLISNYNFILTWVRRDLFSIMLSQLSFFNYTDALMLSLSIFQIDIPTDIQQKSIRAAQRYLSGKDVNPAIFDEAQYQVFKELLPYWAGFVKNFKPPEDEKKPSKKKDKKPLCKLTPFLSAFYNIGNFQTLLIFICHRMFY